MVRFMTGIVGCAVVWLWSSGALVEVAVGQEITPRIINGTPTDDFPSVGIVGTVRFGGFCSGTLISPLHVLTAAHCAELAQGPSDGLFELGGRLYTTSQIYIHPDYNGGTLANDLAIYELSEVVEDVAPSAIHRDPPRVGQILTLVGFGAGGDGQSGQDGTFGVKKVGITEIDDITETLIIWHFENNDESNSAPGDSGGPAFLEIDGQLVVAAVISAGTEPDAILGDVAFNTRVDAFAGWIDSVVFSEEPPEEEPPGDEFSEEPPEEEPAKCPPHPGHRPGHHFTGGGGHRPVPGFRPGGNKRPVHGPRPAASKGPTLGFRPSSNPIRLRPLPVRAVDLPIPGRFAGRVDLTAPWGLAVPERWAAGGRHIINRMVEILFVQAVRTHLSEPGGTSDRLIMSRSAFSAAFSEALGKPPLQYLRECRMQLACRLLRKVGKSPPLACWGTIQPWRSDR